ncbi:hypothetical protein J6590_008747 [Homalodisca vitripennis]|nr:hypothetical protein J6590_008747 [Homalodisca vitripennis]
MLNMEGVGSPLPSNNRYEPVGYAAAVYCSAVGYFLDRPPAPPLCRHGRQRRSAPSSRPIERLELRTLGHFCDGGSARPIQCGHTLDVQDGIFSVIRSLVYVVHVSEYGDPLSTPRQMKPVSRTVGPRSRPGTHCPPLQKQILSQTEFCFGGGGWKTVRNTPSSARTPSKKCRDGRTEPVGA